MTMPALELSFRLQCARMLASQIKSLPVKAMREALARHAVEDPTYDALLLQIFAAAQSGLIAMDRVESKHPLRTRRRGTVTPLPTHTSTPKD
jgi:hypothetical protein